MSLFFNTPLFAFQFGYVKFSFEDINVPSVASTYLKKLPVLNSHEI